MKQLAILNPENASQAEVETYAVREAARAIVVDAEGKIALLRVSTKGYYKLPGGGLEEGEDRLTALQRECQEEIGCGIENSVEVGSITEYRKIFTLKQISYCYVARVKGEKSEPHFTEDEITGGFEVVWLSYDDAKQKLVESNPTDLEGREYIVPRDTIFLEEAKNQYGI